MSTRAFSPITGTSKGSKAECETLQQILGLARRQIRDQARMKHLELPSPREQFTSHVGTLLHHYGHFMARSNQAVPSTCKKEFGTARQLARQ